MVVQPRPERPQAPPAQSLASRCAWHQPLDQPYSAGLGNIRYIGVEPDRSYNDYTDRCEQLHTHLESTLFFQDQRGLTYLRTKAAEKVTAGQLRIVACTTKANRFVMYECKGCGDYVVARHGHHATDSLPLERCRLLWWFKYCREVDPQASPPKPVV